MGTMNLDALVKTGRLPWSPNPSVSDLDTWHQYEHPLAGTFKSHGNTVFFTMVAEYESTSVWAYTCLPGEEAKGLASVQFDSVESLREFADHLLEGRKMAFALAEDLLIKRWSVPDEGGSLYDLGTQFLNQVLEGLKRTRDPGTMLRAKLAQVDVAANELVEA